MRGILVQRAWSAPPAGVGVAAAGSFVFVGKGGGCAVRSLAPPARCGGLRVQVLDPEQFPRLQQLFVSLGIIGLIAQSRAKIGNGPGDLIEERGR